MRAVTANCVSKLLMIGESPVEAEAVRAIAAACGGGVPEDGQGGVDLDALCERLRAVGVDAWLACDDGTAAPSPGEEQSAVLLDAIGEGVCLGDRRGRVLWSNAFFRRLDPATRRLVSERLSEAAGRLEPGMNGDTPTLRFELDAPRAEGAPERVYELFVTPAPPRHLDGGDLGETEAQRARRARRAARDGADRVAGVVRDVTDVLRQRAKLGAIDRAGYELVRLDTAAVRDLNSFERLELLEKKIVRLFHEVLSYDHFAIFLIDERRNKLELVMSAGLPPEIQDLELTPEREGSGISGYVAATGKTYVCRDASTDARFIPGLAGAKSSLTVPLRIHDRVIGILDIESRRADAFDGAAQQFVEIFARYVAFAIHMLDLLVVERSQTNTTVSSRVMGELKEPLDNIVQALSKLERGDAVSPVGEGEVRRIRADVESIRERLAGMADGPQTLIGVDRAREHCERDDELAGRRVLVADDAPKIRKVIGAVLRARGCDVEVVECGSSAIAALEAAGRGDAASFDLVLSDIQMPDRNGYEVFSASRRVQPKAKVILMTGFGYDPHHSFLRAGQQGLEGQLFKPFDIEQLISEVKKALTADVS